MSKKVNAKLVIEVGFKFNVDPDDFYKELNLLKEKLKKSPAPDKPSGRDRINSQIDQVFEEINEVYELKSLQSSYNFYHVLEDPDIEEVS